jgi:hypothetical protein
MIKLPVDEDALEELENQFYWTPDALNEQGWRLSNSDEPAPGEPDGYRPDLDRAMIYTKVHCIAEAMREQHLYEIPEMEYLSMAAEACKRRGKYDQYTIIEMLCQVQKSHGDYWKKVGQGIVKGKDPRTRCWCGKLAKCYNPGKEQANACSPEHYTKE